MRTLTSSSTWFRRFLLGVVMGCGCLAQADPAVAFDEANRLYEQGRYEEAALAYRQLLGQSGVSPALYFNLGNALFRSGQVGQAVYSYRLAERLAPRDPDIQANLRFVREAVQGQSTRGEAAWRRGLNRLTLDEWTLGLTLGLWIWMTLLTLRQWQPARTARWRLWIWIAGGATGLLLLCTTWIWLSRSGSGTAIVIVPETVARYGPAEESPAHHVVRDGTELRVVDAKDDWIGVAHPAQRVVWLKRDRVVIFR